MALYIDGKRVCEECFGMTIRAIERTSAVLDDEEERAREENSWAYESRGVPRDDEFQDRWAP